MGARTKVYCWVKRCGQLIYTVLNQLVEVFSLHACITHPSLWQHTFRASPNVWFALLSPGAADDDECSRISPCSHYCHNHPGGFSCSCPIGLSLHTDGRMCKGSNVASLVITRQKRSLHLGAWDVACVVLARKTYRVVGTSVVVR